MRLEDIQDLANKLDIASAHRHADVITDIMIKVAEEKDHEHGMVRRQIDKVE